MYSCWQIMCVCMSTNQTTYICIVQLCISGKLNPSSPGSVKSQKTQYLHKFTQQPVCFCEYMKNKDASLPSPPPPPPLPIHTHTKGGVGGIQFLLLGHSDIPIIANPMSRPQFRGSLGMICVHVNPCIPTQTCVREINQTSVITRLVVHCASTGTWAPCV